MAGVASSAHGITTRCAQYTGSTAIAGGQRESRRPWVMEMYEDPNILLQIDVATGDKYYQAGVWKDGKMQVGDWQR